jgi:hypothetical protein
MVIFSQAFVDPAPFLPQKNGNHEPDGERWVLAIESVLHCPTRARKCFSVCFFFVWKAKDIDHRFTFLITPRL